MSKGSNKNTANNNALLNLITVVIIAAFLALGVYAGYGKISEGIEDKAIANGEREATVGYLARQAGMPVDEYLAQYGLSVGDTIKKNTTQSEMAENMTIENYLSYSGDERTADDVIAEAGLGDAVTKDTIWKDFEAQAPTSFFISDEETFNQIKEYYGLGDEVTLDMPYSEFEALLDAKAEEQANAASEETAENTVEVEEEAAEGEAAEAETAEAE